ncbi:MAG: recombinase family protein, partial [Clostridia bacterium]|nr:recombinase family protein [Clostridia bacterium]
MSTVKRIETRQIKQFQRKRVAAYARVSVDTEQLMHSLSAQVSYYSNLIQGTPEWEYVGVYIDAGITGTDTKPRERFQEMIADCEAGKIDIILTKSISRFARNTVDLLATVRHLKELGVEVRFEREHVNTFTSDGEVMLSILASFAEQESISLSQNIKWRVRKNYEQGKPHAHLKLYGYRWEGDERIIEPDEAEVVRFIFAEYLSGKSFREIATELDEKEIRSVRGTKHFSPQTLRKMISNEEYTGCQIYQQVYAYKPHKQRINYGELPKYRVDDHHEAIIDPDT